MPFASAAIREYGAERLWSRSADWGGVRATIMRRERLREAGQRFVLPWHAFRLGISGSYAAGSTTRIGGGRAPLATGPGWASFYPRGVEVLNDITEASRQTYLMLEIDVGASDEEAALGRLPPVMRLADPLCVALLRRLHREVERPEAASRVMAESAALVLVHAVAASPSQAKPAAGGLSPGQLARLTDYMRDHLADDIGLEALAALAGVSRAHLCRAFKASTGMTPGRWLVRQRIERAQDLMAGGGLPLAAVAAATGFADQSHFTNAFRRHVGISPGRWRRLRA